MYKKTALDKERNERHETAKQKDALDQIVNQFDLSGATQESLFGPGGLVRALATRFLNKALDAEMDTHSGLKKYEL